MIGLLQDKAGRLESMIENKIEDEEIKELFVK